MLNKKLFVTILSLSMLASTLFMPMNTQASERNEKKEKTIKTLQNKAPKKLLANGKHTQYPQEGGEWVYGFWDLKVRSYYTVDKCYGSTVEYNGKATKSIDTYPGEKSIAQKYALNLPGSSDAYYYRLCD